MHAYVHSVKLMPLYILSAAIFKKGKGGSQPSETPLHVEWTMVLVYMYHNAFITQEMDCTYP